MAIFYNNMDVGKSKYLITLHPHDLTQPFLRGCSDLELKYISTNENREGPYSSAHFHAKVKSGKIRPSLVEVCTSSP